MNELEYRKRIIKEELWRRDFIKELNRSLTEFIISPPNYDEYVGKSKENLYKPNILHAVSKMFSAMIINYCIDKVIDAVIEADERLIPHQSERKE